jgi:hypothetical protein
MPRQLLGAAENKNRQMTRNFELVELLSDCKTSVQHQCHASSWAQLNMKTKQ